MIDWIHKHYELDSQTARCHCTRTIKLLKPNKNYIVHKLIHNNSYVNMLGLEII